MFARPLVAGQTGQMFVRQAMAGQMFGRPQMAGQMFVRPAVARPNNPSLFPFETPEKIDDGTRLPLFWWEYIAKRCGPTAAGKLQPAEKIAVGWPDKQMFVRPDECVSGQHWPDKYLSGHWWLDKYVCVRPLLAGLVAGQMFVRPLVAGQMFV